MDVEAPASQVRVAVARLGEAKVPIADRVLTALSGPVGFDVETVSHTRTRLRIRGARGGRVARRAVGAIGRRTERRAVHYTRFGIRTGASTVAIAAARRRR